MCAAAICHGCFGSGTRRQAVAGLSTSSVSSCDLLTQFAVSAVVLWSAIGAMIRAGIWLCFGPMRSKAHGSTRADANRPSCGAVSEIHAGLDPGLCSSPQAGTGPTASGGDAGRDPSSWQAESERRRSSAQPSDSRAEDPTSPGTLLERDCNGCAGAASAT